jgi:hypothetical protein
MIINKPFSFFYKYIVIALLLTNNAMANDQAKLIDNYSRELLKILEWDTTYRENRTKDIEYLLGSLDGEKVNNLTKEQKEQILQSMRDATLKQILNDTNHFKNHLLKQYNTFFTLDEIRMLIAYFKTELMQTVIKSQIDYKKISIEEISYKLNSAKESDKIIIEEFRNSYLNERYIRFQKKVTPALNEMIYKRLEEILGAVLVLDFGSFLP